MKIDTDSLRSALKLCPEGVECSIILEPTQNAIAIRFTDKGGRDVKVVIYDNELSMFPTITYTDRLPR